MNKPLWIQLNQWKIGTRLGVGFSMVLFLFVVVSLFNWSSRNDNQRAFVLYSQVSATSAAILEINHQIINLQSAILTYSQTGHRAGVARIKKLYAKVQESLTKIRPSFTDTRRQDILNKMNAVLYTYNENIDTLFVDRERYDLYTTATLPQAADKVRAILKSFSKYREYENYQAIHSSIEQITEKFLGAIVDANSFFAIRNYALQQRAKDNLAEAVKVWTKLQTHKNNKELQQLVKDLGVAINDYSIGFNDALRMTRGYLFLVNVVIPGEAAEFENLSSNLTELTLENLKEVSESTERNVQDSQQKISIITTIGIVLGVILAFLISKSIVTPLQMISVTFKQLVKRERVDSIPGLDRNDEIGQLAKAADVFREISENRFQSIFDESPIGIAVIDSLTGQIHEVNAKFTKIAGRTREEMTTIDWMEIMHPDDVQEGLDNMARLNAGEITGFQTDKRCLQPDGTVVWINMTVSSIQVSEKTSPHHLCMIEDITERKQLEDKLRQTQKMESIGNLAGGIAHDFNNILYPIIGFTEMSMQDLPKTHEVQENLQDILSGAKRARDLVKQILLFARQEKQTLKPMVLKPLVEEAMKLLRSTIPANIEIQSDLYDGEDYVLCDATEMHEIVVNLCTNAYHSMEENGGTIIVQLNKQNPSPDMNLSSGEYICLSVSDTGIGIPKDIINKIFEPYLTTKEVGKGSGLGLSVVHGIVTNYGGGVSVESSPGKGSIFNVFLPLTTPLKKVEQNLKEDKPLEGTENILFVDDEASIVKLANRILERLGYTITGKTNSTEAFELFKNKPDEFDLVITDMAMPIMTGAELAKKILKIRSDMPIIICTGFSEKIDSEIAKSIGIKGYIKKPILTDELTSKIREVLDQSSKG